MTIFTQLQRKRQDDSCHSKTLLLCFTILTILTLQQECYGFVSSVVPHQQKWSIPITTRVTRPFIKTKLLFSFLPNPPNTTGAALSSKTKKNKNSSFPSNNKNDDNKNDNNNNKRNNRFKRSSSSSSLSSSRTRSQTWYKNRTGKNKNTKKTKNRKRTPRWEKEGDDLYQLINHDDSTTTTTRIFNTKQEEYQYMEQLLVSTMTKQQQQQQHDETQEYKTTTIIAKKDKEQDDASSKPSNKKMIMMWGTCSVGPLLRTKLINTYSDTPTPIQQMSFPLITSSKQQNIIVASPTGTGKTLAYLLPLLSTMSRPTILTGTTTTTTKDGSKKTQEPTTTTSSNNNNGIVACQVMIVTPTIDLAHQIQQQVDCLWPPSVEDNIPSAMYIVEQQPNTKNDNENENDNNVLDDPLKTGLVQAPIVAGTPRALYQMMINLKKARRPSDGIKNSMYSQMISNLRTIVLDEADRLLRTESVARNSAATAVTATAASKTKKSFTKQNNNNNSKKSPTEILLSQFPRLNYHYAYTNTDGGGITTTSPNNTKKKKKKKKNASSLSSSTKNIQLICASATVGRTLRRQIMDIIDAPSIDKAATLVTADPKRTKKGTASSRKSTLLPSTIQHLYVHYPPNSVTNRNDETESITTTAVADALVQTIRQHLSTPAPLLVFPGKMGVSTMVQILQDTYGFQNVQTLQQKQVQTQQGNTNTAHADDTDTATSSTATSSGGTATLVDAQWVTMPIYVIGEKFGRGLDLQVDYVWLSSPPSSPAAYTHLAGRTGRNNQKGCTLTYVSSLKDAHKVIQLSDRLGIEFRNIDTAISTSTSASSDKSLEPSLAASAFSSAKDEDTVLNISIDHDEHDDSNKDKSHHPWSSLSKSALGRKTVAELRQYLEERDIATTDTLSGKKLLKADLIAKVGSLS